LSFSKRIEAIIKAMGELAWYAEFLLVIIPKNFLRKPGARLNFKIALISLHIDPGEACPIKEKFN
jgi:hypothetical protein